jgi:hypothetical protein
MYLKKVKHVKSMLHFFDSPCVSAYTADDPSDVA